VMVWQIPQSQWRMMRLMINRDQWRLMQVKWLLNKQSSRIIITGWWFQRFFMFHSIWDNPSHWLIFSRGVETNNQSSNCIFQVRF
jgi:hypothetical protein